MAIFHSYVSLPEGSFLQEQIDIQYQEIYPSKSWIKPI
jgi:hypothetical protein